MIFGITRKLYPKALYISSSRTAWTAPCIILAFYQTLTVAIYCVMPEIKWRWRILIIYRTQYVGDLYGVFVITNFRMSYPQVYQIDGYRRIFLHKLQNGQSTVGGDMVSCYLETRKRGNIINRVNKKTAPSLSTQMQHTQSILYTYVLL